MAQRRSSACSGRGDNSLRLQSQKTLELLGRLLYLNSQESSLEIASVSIFLIKSSSVYLFVIPNVVKLDWRFVPRWFLSSV